MSCLIFLEKLEQIPPYFVQDNFGLPILCFLYMI